MFHQFWFTWNGVGSSDSISFSFISSSSNVYNVGDVRCQLGEEWDPYRWTNPPADVSYHFRILQTSHLLVELTCLVLILAKWTTSWCFLLLLFCYDCKLKFWPVFLKIAIHLKDNRSIKIWISIFYFIRSHHEWITGDFKLKISVSFKDYSFWFIGIIEPVHRLSPCRAHPFRAGKISSILKHLHQMLPLSWTVPPSRFDYSCTWC